jgi:hypothetical protein
MKGKTSTDSYSETARFFSKPNTSSSSETNDNRWLRPQRISPWRMFIGSMIPNWLLCRKEVSPGAKLTYARLTQYAGKHGRCFPKQRTLAGELGVTERTARSYLHELVSLKLIEIKQLGLQKPNRYFFLDHPWIDAPQSNVTSTAEERQVFVAPEEKNLSGPMRRDSSAPYRKENQKKGESDRTTHSQSCVCDDLPRSVEEAIEVARQLGIDRDFAIQEFHAKKSVNWKDGYGNSITSWSDHLQARWSIEQRKRRDRHSIPRQGGKRQPQPSRRYNSKDYQQASEDL